MTILYIVLAFVIVLTMFVVLFVIAGRDIANAFYRFFFRKGCDVFVVNHNRHVAHYYRVPKDGAFKIDKKPYVTNPDKLLGMEERIRDYVKKGLEKRKDKLQKKIESYERDLQGIEKRGKALKDVEGSEKEIEELRRRYNIINGRKEALLKKLESREQGYYHRRRGAFFYIEGDPIPKDFHELYTEMDAIMLDNMLARSMTKDPRAVHDLEKTLRFQKYVTIALIIVGCILAFLVFQNNGILKSLAETSGVSITI